MSNILQELEAQIAGLKTSVQKTNVGTVREIGDGVAKVEGLSEVMLNEMFDFGNNKFGLDRAGNSSLPFAVHRQ